MPYEARISRKSNMKNVRFSGDLEFVRYEWRPLPDDKLELARNNPYLEIRAVGNVETEIQTPTIDELVEQEPVEILKKGSAEEWLKQDDLTRIKMIGKATAAVLSLYYPTFSSIINADPDEMRKVLLENQMVRLMPEYLKEQAAKLEAEKEGQG